MDGPWLQAAVFCRFLVEPVTADDVAAVDVVERIEIEAGEQTHVSLVIALVRGGWRSPITVRVLASAPSGDSVATMEITRDPPWGPSGTGRIVVPIALVAGQPGVYWFDIELNTALVTRVPLQIDWQQPRLLF